MCGKYVPYFIAAELHSEPLTASLLACWQREYDRSPYRNFVLEACKFEQNLSRSFDATRDLKTVVQFLNCRCIASVQIFGIDFSPNAGGDLIEFVRILRKMRIIELQMMTLPSVIFVELSRLSCLMRVKELSFERTPLDTKSVKYLQIFLCHSKTLTHLNVSDCNITQYNFALLANGVLNCCTMCSFHCNRIECGYRLSMDTFKLTRAVVMMIFQRQLQKIEMKFCQFTDKDIEFLAEHFTERSCRLCTLNLAYNDIGTAGAIALFENLKWNRTLRNLDISGNCIGTLGGYAVAKYLATCNRLQYLAIRNNNIGADAMHSILMSQSRKPLDLLQLKIYGNNFNLKAAKTLKLMLDMKNAASFDVVPIFGRKKLSYRIARCSNHQILYN